MVWKLFPGLIVFICTVAVTAGAQNFRASCVKIKITPDKPQWLLGYAARQSSGAHDDLYHRIVAMDDGAMQFFLVSTDICLISPSYYDLFTQELEKATGIKKSQVWWTVTHTHSAPEVGPPGMGAAVLSARYDHAPNPEYSEKVKNTLIEGIRQARNKLEPARLAVGTGFSMANINRRARDPEGRTSLGLNPEGPADRQIGLIRLERPDASPIALIANYAMHGTVLGPQNLEISGDAQGVVAEYVEGKLGAPMLYINGAAGNMAPIYSVYPDFKSGHITQFNVLLGDRILAANQSMKRTLSEVQLRTGEQIIETPQKPGLKWPEDLTDYRLAQGEAYLVRIPVRFLGISDEVVIWAAPLELFCEIAIQVRQRSPFPFTFFFGYCNGWLSYLTTKAAFSEGGYEIMVSPFTEQAEEDFTQGVLITLQGMAR